MMLSKQLSSVLCTRRDLKTPGTATPCPPQPGLGAQTGSRPGEALLGCRPPSRRRHPARTLGLFLALLVAAAGLFLGIRYGLPHGAEQFVVSPGTLVIDQSGPGTLDAIKRSAVGARVQGRITAMHVDRNDRIKAGEIIAEIAAEDLKSQLQAAIASHRAAQLAVIRTRAEQERAAAALVNARATFKRQASLLDSGSSTQASYDSALAALLQAEADIAAGEAVIAEAEAQEQSAQATVEIYRAQLDEAVVRAPFGGIVVSREQYIGDIVTPGSPIVEIVDPKTIVLSARFDESLISSIRPGQKAFIHFTSQPHRPIQASVLRLSRQVDAETREFSVDIVPDMLPPNWALGQRGTAMISIAAKADVLTVPTRAIVRRNEETGLWLVRKGRAHFQPVELGSMGGQRVEVRSGLDAGNVVLAPSGVFEWMRISDENVIAWMRIIFDARGTS